jgi:hypothetical protein
MQFADILHWSVSGAQFVVLIGHLTWLSLLPVMGWVTLFFHFPSHAATDKQQKMTVVILAVFCQQN